MSMYYYEARVHHVTDVPNSSPEMVVVRPFEQSVMSPYLAGRMTPEEYNHILAQLKAICDDAVATGTLCCSSMCCRASAILTCGLSLICTGLEHPSDRQGREFRQRVEQLCASINAGLLPRGVRISPHYASMPQWQMWNDECLVTTPWGLNYWAFELGPASAARAPSATAAVVVNATALPDRMHVPAADPKPGPVMQMQPPANAFTPAAHPQPASLQPQPAPLAAGPLQASMQQVYAAPVQTRQASYGAPATGVQHAYAYSPAPHAQQPGHMMQQPPAQPGHMVQPAYAAQQPAYVQQQPVRRC